MMGHVRKAIMKLTSVIIVIAVTFINVLRRRREQHILYIFLMKTEHH